MNFYEARFQLAPSVIDFHQILNLKATKSPTLPALHTQKSMEFSISDDKKF
jgi:hypothetical protein